MRAGVAQSKAKRWPIVKVPICGHLDDGAWLHFRHRRHPSRGIECGIWLDPFLGAVGAVVELRIMVHKGVIIFLRSNMLENLNTPIYVVIGLTIPFSSKRRIVSLDVFHAGAVHPLGFLPVNLVATSMDFFKISRCVFTLRPDTYSCEYPWRALGECV